ncbi:MAG: radical SAM protein [Sandaracinaceae bacterium]
MNDVGGGRVPRPGDERATELRYVVWEITLACDLSCHHCGSRAGKPRSNELSTEEALDVVAQLADMGTHEVVLIGGEAYLREDWTTIIGAIADRGMRAAMVSGGRSLTAERARAAKDAGLDAVSFSIDGLRDTHDLQRGLRGAFDAATQGMKNAVEAGLVVTGNSQINRLSFPELDGIYDHLRAHGATGWQLAMTVPMGRAAERPHWLLQPWELIEVFPKLGELAERGAREGLLLFPGNNVGYFGPEETTLRGRGIDDSRAWGGCIAGVSALGIESDGSIKGCPSLPSASWVGGSVRERSVRDIWEDTPPLRYVRDREVDARSGATAAAATTPKSAERAAPGPRRFCWAAQATTPTATTAPSIIADAGSASGWCRTRWASGSPSTTAASTSSRRTGRTPAPSPPPRARLSASCDDAFGARTAFG